MYKIPAVERALIKKKMEQCLNCTNKNHGENQYFCYMWKRAKDIPIKCGYKEIMK